MTEWQGAHGAQSPARNRPTQWILKGLSGSRCWRRTCRSGSLQIAQLTDINAMESRAPGTLARGGGALSPQRGDRWLLQGPPGPQRENSARSVHLIKCCNCFRPLFPSCCLVKEKEGRRVLNGWIVLSQGLVYLKNGWHLKSWIPKGTNSL